MIEELIGTSNSSNLSHPDTPQRIKTHIPDVRLFACLRNPADQVYSQYNLGRVRGKYTKPFDSLVRDENFASLKHVFHAKHINNYLKYFDRSKLLILLYDDMVSDPQGFLKNVYTFLNVNDYYPEFPNRRVNYSREPRSAFLDRFIAGVGTALRESNLLRLKIALNRVGISNKLKEINSRRTTPKPLDPKVREYLNSLYGEDKKRLEILIDRDLSIWH